MAQDISGFGLTLALIASNTFPVGIPITQFADDGDPLDLPSITIAESAMGVNGDMVKWSKAIPIKVSLSVIPSSTDDINLSILFDANRVAKGKRGARDVITITGIYGDGRTISLLQGIITDGMPAEGVSSTGRIKSKTYSFTFEDIKRAY
jgi:hypothetical protein